MKILHTADLHLGQIIYQNYDRVDEHEHYFAQIEKICLEEQPDALIVCGDVFDIQQPSASTWKFFTEHFVELHFICPEMKIVITAGNHDSASRIQADSAVWKLANASLVGIAPSPELMNAPDGWQNNYIVKINAGYIVAIPYMSGERSNVIQSILDWVAKDNTEGKPVVMMGHLAVSGADPCGHNIEIGKIKTQSSESLGSGYDYIALGHIHKPQTIGYPEDSMKEEVTYQSGVIRYSGSALHVSCDEKYPHTVSLVEIKVRGGDVHIRQIRINELRHFHELPEDGSSFMSPEAAREAVKAYAKKYVRGYFRLRFDFNAALPSNFNNEIYDILNEYNKYGDEIRFNPKHIWTGVQENVANHAEKKFFEVANLAQMTDPIDFIKETMDQYPGLDLESVRAAFEEVKKEMRRLEEEKIDAAKAKTKKKTAVTAAEAVSQESSIE